MLKLKDKATGDELTLDSDEQFEALAVVCGAGFSTPDITVEITFNSDEIGGWLTQADELRAKASKLKGKVKSKPLKIDNSLN